MNSFTPLVSVEWSGAFAPIAQSASILRPSTWPPAAFVLPVGLGCSVWLLRGARKGTLAFGFALLFFSAGLLLLFYNLPLYTSPIWLGITRPALIPVPFLWAIVGWACWTFRSSDRLLPPLTLMAIVMVLAHVPMLYSRAPHDTQAMVAHLGKVAAYLVLLLSVMELASVDMSERVRAERDLALRQQTEAALRKSQADLSLIVEGSPGAIVVVNQEGSGLLLHPPKPKRDETWSTNVILLVEDNLKDEALTLRALKKSNIAADVIVVRDGVEALDYFFGTGKHSGRDTTVMPQLILLDLKLPKLNGLEVLSRIRADERTRRLPVVVFTSSSEDEDLIKSYDLGANSYVRKPVEFEHLLDAIKQLGLYWLKLNQVASSA